MSKSLFGDDDGATPSPKRGRSRRIGEARIVCAERSQMILTPFSVDLLVSAQHPVRSVWAFVERLDLSVFLDRIRAREDGPGRSAKDPRVLFALWLYALKKKCHSSHELARLCVEHSAFRWLCGDKPINQHTLSDFRSTNREAFEQILVEMLATLFHSGVLKMKRVAHDGVKIRASSGQASFRREPTLLECLKTARARLKAAKKKALDPKRNKRKAAARLRAANDRAARLERALAGMPAAREANSKRREPKDARVSSTDPDARVMRMGDGGFRPAFNVQLAADTQTRLLVGVSVSNVGTDFNELTPMIDEIAKRTGRKPDEVLVDGGFVNHEQLDDAARQGVTVYAPPKKTKANPDPFAPKPTDSKETRAWRTRMATDAAKLIYRERGAVIETVNADLKAHRGLEGVNVRGLDRVSSVVLLAALGYNVSRLIALGLA